jgi:hypothetical protein
VIFLGMFDNMDIEVECLYCGRKISGFQTKSGGCYLHTYSPGDVVDDRDGDEGYNSGKEPTEFYCYSSCDHRYEEGEKHLGYQVLHLAKWIQCHVTIPVENHIISPDREKWKIEFEVREEEDGYSVHYAGGGWVDIKAFNSKIEELEEKRWN